MRTTAEANFPPTDRTRLHRIPARGSYDRARVHAILDEAWVCHLGFVLQGQPFVIPTTHVRVGEQLYVHGAAASRMLGALAAGVPVCVTVTLLDGLVLARSAFHHSMNYRSVVVLGVATELTDPVEKRAVLAALVERMESGRAQVVREPSDKELRATRVLGLPLVELSAKLREGGPLDDPEDLARPCWAGHVPLKLERGEPITG